MRIQLFDLPYCYVTDEVSTIPTNQANLSKDNRVKFVTDLAAISRGKDESSNPQGRFNQLLNEAANNPLYLEKDHVITAASRPLEFCPVRLEEEVLHDLGSKYLKGLLDHDLVNKILRYSYVEEILGKITIYTNLRALVNAGIPETAIPFNKENDVKNFKAIKVAVPMHIWAQLMTHTAISKESQSDRVAKNDNYWLPRDLFNKIINAEDKITSINAAIAELQSYLKDLNLKDEDVQNWNKAIMDKFLAFYPQLTVQSIFKDLGYKREIYSRAPYYFKIKEVIMTGWMNDPAVWNHFLLEREAFPELHKSWVQKETAEVVRAIKDLLLA